MTLFIKDKSFFCCFSLFVSSHYYYTVLLPMFLTGRVNGYFDPTSEYTTIKVLGFVSVDMKTDTCT